VGSFFVIFETTMATCPDPIDPCAATDPCADSPVVEMVVQQAYPVSASLLSGVANKLATHIIGIATTDALAGADDCAYRRDVDANLSRSIGYLLSQNVVLSYDDMAYYYGIIQRLARKYLFEITLLPNTLCEIPTYAELCALFPTYNSDWCNLSYN